MAMKVNSEVIKAAVAGYYRYTRQCSLVAFETNAKFRWGGELADIVIVNGDHHLTVIEVKISLGDLRRDQHKSSHLHMARASQGNFIEGATPVLFPSPPRGPGLAKHFYFAVPRDIANKVCLVCDELYPYAGVIGCHGLSYLDLTFYRKAKDLHGQPLTPDDIESMTRGQTATLCRLATKVAELKGVQKGLVAQIKELRLQ